jgi:hypothetical protein
MRANWTGESKKRRAEMSLDQRFVEEFERLMQEVELVIQTYPPELRPALRDEARVAFRLQLQQRWEDHQRALDEARSSDRLP